MRTERPRALLLRQKGRSYSEISKSLSVPKSTVADWLGKIPWSINVKEHLTQEARELQRVRIRTMNAVRGERLARLYAEAAEEARREFSALKRSPLFITGISLYWGEGDKASKHLVRLGNTDPIMMGIFVDFLKMTCNIPQSKIRAYILLYPDLDPKKCLSLWVRSSGLSRKNFNKSIIIQGRHKSRRVPYGVCSVTVNSSYLKVKINTWLQLLPKSLN
ncbi:MAG: helix-turn-helix domain-containing protein [Patescibacteria group bacterium]